MNPESEIKEPEITQPEDQIEEIDADASPSVDDFIKELEAKEKDLDITADYQIEIEDPDFDASIPDFVQQELSVNGNATAQSEGRPSAAAKTKIFELEKEIESLNNKLTALRMERNDVQEKSDRRRKDFESYKYRMDRERRGAMINQIGNLATQMLPVLDNLDRALDFIEDVPANKREEFKQFFDGIALVNHQINDVLSGMGVQPIITVGEAFDPNFHEAVATEENTDMPPNSISAEMLRGYRIGNLVIRHSMVKVTTGPPIKAVSQDDAEHVPAEESSTTEYSEPTDATAEERPTTDAEPA